MIKLTKENVKQYSIKFKEDARSTNNGLEHTIHFWAVALYRGYGQSEMDKAILKHARSKGIKGYEKLSAYLRQVILTEKL